ncbi:hypothetical protein NIE88_14060 [Sporolactobacillus shoreicorticis]|uniref:Uncharacterized protein n=1 Tax=Sporolactobacillus shoreicorticis TaxID=1923877 RepID=A0ABW5S886_9BACL|nr:hypothetical protein [Sporolactobacillus shoreicorticis]MCO7126892.1 hypothetical protein [Sporolactobacillus shoreicorticis]
MKNKPLRIAVFGVTGGFVDSALLAVSDEEKPSITPEPGSYSYRLVKLNEQEQFERFYDEYVTKFGGTL